MISSILSAPAEDEQEKARRLKHHADADAALRLAYAELSTRQMDVDHGQETRIWRKIGAMRWRFMKGLLRIAKADVQDKKSIVDIWHFMNHAADLRD